MRDIKVIYSMEECGRLMQYARSCRLTETKLIKRMVLNKISDLETELAESGAVSVHISHSLSCREYAAYHIYLNDADYGTLRKYAGFMGFSLCKFVRMATLPTIYLH